MSGRAPRPVDVLLGHLASVCVAALVICGLAVLGNRARALEVTGMGRGDKSRSMDAAISQIEQTYEEKRQDLERDNRNGKFTGRKDDYARELALINEFQKKSIASLVEAMRLGMRGYSDGGVVGSDANRFTPNTAGAVLPSGAQGGGGAPVIVTINNTVGDVATLSMLKEAQAGTERRIAGALGRSQRYGGSLV